MVAVACGAPLVQAQSVCQQGYVWREAYPGDHVCVTPETRAQVAADNAAAASRRVSPNSDICIKGYVWRNARPEDHVCVTPQIRKQTDEEKRRASPLLAGTPQGAPLITNLPRGFHIVDPSLAMARRHPLGIAGQAGALSQDNVSAHLHPAPAAPLPSSVVVNILQNGFGIPATGVFPDREAKIGGYFISADTNQNSSCFTETRAQALTEYEAGTGISGYAEIDFNVFPNNQYLVDCPIYPDGAYNVGVWLTDSNYRESQVLWGSSPSQKGHLLIPFPTPANARYASVAIYFPSGSGDGNIFSLDGCQLSNVATQ